MLGWWTDKSKGDYLEDLKTPGKLISSHDVNFIEDSLPSDLAVIDKIPLSPESVNKLVDNGIFMDSTTSSLLAPDPTKVHLPESHLSTPSSEPVKESLLSPPAPKKVSIRRPLTHDPGAPSIASQHNCIVQPLVTKE